MNFFSRFDSTPTISTHLFGNGAPLLMATLAARDDDDSDRESPPSDDEGNIFEWAEKNLEDEYWKEED